LIAVETRGVALGKNDVSRPQCAQEGSRIGGRQRYKALYWLSQVAREPAAQPLRDPISETRIQGQKATNSASADVIAGLINNLKGATRA
jgi:hypothetical protein